jgi:hypothetical protein
VETIARIRREHFIMGKTIKEIVRDLKVSRNTVRKVLRSGETSFEYERVVQSRPQLGRWAAELDGVRAWNAAKAARHPRVGPPDDLIARHPNAILRRMAPGLLGHLGRWERL